LAWRRHGSFCESSCDVAAKLPKGNPIGRVATA
jgi:hypothetical protein